MVLNVMCYFLRHGVFLIETKMTRYILDCSSRERHIVSICQVPRNSPKIWTYSSSRSSRVIDLGANRKRINSNFRRISYRFWHIDAFISKIACFPHHSSSILVSIEKAYTTSY